MLSTEEMVLQIQRGDTGGISGLWERLGWLLGGMARKIYSGYALPPWVAFEDIFQLGYFAMLRAIDDYKPEKGYRFTSYLRFHYGNVVKEYLGIRGRKKIEWPVSGDAPAFPDSEESILAFVPDETAAFAFEQAEELSYQEDLHNALEVCLNTLAQDLREVIRERFYKGKARAEIAQESGCTPENIRRMEAKALGQLRRPACKRILKPFLEDCRGVVFARTGLQAFQTHFVSCVEKVVQ